jgi:hypothetical protein
MAANPGITNAAIRLERRSARKTGLSATSLIPDSRQTTTELRLDTLQFVKPLNLSIAAVKWCTAKNILKSL